MSMHILPPVAVREDKPLTFGVNGPCGVICIEVGTLDAGLIMDIGSRRIFLFARHFDSPDITQCDGEARLDFSPDGTKCSKGNINLIPMSSWSIARCF